MIETIKLTKRQYAALYALTFATLAIRTSPFILVFALYHYYGFGAAMVGILGLCIGQTINGVHDEVAALNRTAQLMKAFNEAVDREQGATK